MNWKCLQRKKKENVEIFLYHFNLLPENFKVMAEKWVFRHRLIYPQPVSAALDKESWRDIVSLHLALYFRDPKDLGASSIFQ